jgi:hypothetical protein
MSQGQVGMVFVSYLLGMIGAVVLGITVADMYRCDILGAQVERYMRPEGLEQPRPFVMKRLSRVALSCRNPLMTGQLMCILAPLLMHTKGLTLGSAHMSLLFIVGTFAGVFFEQREVERALGYRAYGEYRRCVPNVLWPDWGRILFTSDEEITQLRKAVLQACGSTDEGKYE